MSSLGEKREEEDALLRRAANATACATNATNTNRFKSRNDYFEEEEEGMDVAAMMWDLAEVSGAKRRSIIENNNMNNKNNEEKG